MELQAIQNKIYEIRGQKVMLDFDLAEMYGIETRVLKQAVRRNPKRFEGNDFMFELNDEEVENLSRCKNFTLNMGRGSNIKTIWHAKLASQRKEVTNMLHSLSRSKV